MLTSKRFYFIKAWHEWITDNLLTPYIIVDAQYPGVRVPEEHIDNGRITLNVSSQAVSRFNLTPKKWEFEADFTGSGDEVGVSGEHTSAFLVVVPIKAIVAIYAQENREGAFFLEEEDDGSDSLVQSKSTSDKKLPAFTVVEE